MPSELAQLTALTVLNIDESALSGTLPAGLAPTLETILLASNPSLSGTLPSFAGLTKLLELDLSRTALSGSLGAGVGELTTMRKLQLDHR